MHTFPFQGSSMAQMCWNLFPLLLGEQNSVLQRQAVARTWSVVVVLGLLCRTVLSSCDGELRWGALSALLCPITVPHNHALSSFTSPLCGPVCCDWGELSFLLLHTPVWVSPETCPVAAQPSGWTVRSPLVSLSAHKMPFPLCTENRIHSEERAGPRRLCASHRNSIWKPESGRSGPPVY